MLKKGISFFIFLILSTAITGCGIYSFTGADIDYSKTKSFQVNYFQNNAAIVEPGMAREFTQQLQDLLLNQTSLDLVNSGGDLTYEGEITEYYIAPITATSQNTAAQNRLTISINVRFLIKTVKKKALNNAFHFTKITPGKAC